MDPTWPLDGCKKIKIKNFTYIKDLMDAFRRTRFWLRSNADPDLRTVLRLCWCACLRVDWPGSMSRQWAGSSPSAARLSMDSSSSFSSQPRSFLFLLEPIRASTENAWALELRAAADRLLSLISLRSARGKKKIQSVRPKQWSRKKKQKKTGKQSGRNCTRQSLQQGANSPRAHINPRWD